MYIYITHVYIYIYIIYRYIKKIRVPLGFYYETVYGPLERFKVHTLIILGLMKIRFRGLRLCTSAGCKLGVSKDLAYICGTT